VIPGVQVADLAGGMIAGFAILAALLVASEPARVSTFDVSMFDVMLSMLPISSRNQFAGNAIPGWRKMCYRALTRSQRYETSDGEFMTLGALEPKFWQFSVGRSSARI